MNEMKDIKMLSTEEEGEVVTYQTQQTLYVIKEYFIGNALYIK